MARNQVDLIDVLPLIALPIFTGFLYGVWTLELNVFGGFDFTSIWWTFSTIDVSPAFIISVAASGMIVGTNELDGSDYEGYEYALIIAVLAMPLLYELIPAVTTFIDSADVWRLLLWVVTTALATYISYVE